MSSKLSISMPQPPSNPRAVNRDCSWRVAENLLTSFQYAWAGVSYAFKTQRNFRIHVALGCIVAIAGTILRVSAIEAAILAIVICLVLVLELLNTALESVVDLTVQQTYHELAKVAKDCAAGAVLIAAISSLIVGASIFVPRLAALLA